MFDNITSSFSKVFDSFAGKKFISEDNLNDAMREIRVALLEADVSLSVAKDFIAKVKEEALGQQVIKSVSPSQMIVKIVHDQMVKLLGENRLEINLEAKPPIVILMVGLQGAGKTTTAGKLANYFLKKHNKKRILLASLDTYRPAAQKQLEILAEKVGVDGLEIVPQENPVTIAKRAVKKASEMGYEILILDSAGRTHIDENMMQELVEVKKISNPTETILVADALIGQDAINVALSFKEQLGIDGVILTRIDGDSRGGAAITMKMATGCAIKFLGSGEKIDELEVFDPQRIAGRIFRNG